MNIATLKIINKDALPNEVEFNVDASAVAEIIDWYSAFYAGDDYRVYVNGTEQTLDHNGCIDGELAQ